MIPLKLQLKNFLSYGPQLQTIDFAPYHLICLNGKNGHGKSALLDAITWAVWGQARKTSGTVKPDAQLMRLGQSHMLVIFEFQFNGQRYRIRREYAETAGKPYAALDFGIIDPQTDKIHSLTDKTIRLTQEKIESMLGLSFDSFVNTAFLRQGQSNEFSKKTPKERKDILASILNLNQYDQLRNAAFAKTKHAAADSHVIDQLHQRMTVQLEQEPLFLEQLSLVEHQMSELDTQALNVLQQMAQLDEIKKKLATAAQQLHIAQFNHDQSARETKEKTEQLQKLFSHWRLIHRHHRHMPDTSEIEKEYAAAAQRLVILQEQAQKRLTAQQEYLALREKTYRITQKNQQEIQTQLAMQQRAIDRVTSSIEHKNNNILIFEQQKKVLEEKNLELQKAHAAYEEQHAKIAHLLKNKEQLAQQFEKRKNYYHRWNAQFQIIHSELMQFEQKKLMTEDITNPSCPWCEQNLSAARKRFLRNKLDRNEYKIARRAGRLKAALAKLKQLLIDQHTQISQLQKNEQEFSTLELMQKTNDHDMQTCAHEQAALEAALQAAHKEISEHQKENAQLEEQRTILQNRLTTCVQEDPEYKEIIATMNDIEQEVKAMNYSEGDLEKAAQLAASAQKKLTDLRQLVHEASLQKERSQAISQLCAQIKLRRKEYALLQIQLEAHVHEKNELELALASENKIREQAATLQHEKERLLEQKGQLAHQLKTCAMLKKEMREQIEKKKELNTIIDEYHIIATAFGKEGIQALLIEDALPEIEYEANLLLAELTHNQAHIIIDSLRDLKKGGTKETLEIKISDPLGIRPYEMFSGGEAFRIDFALRIAISKLLARRAGTSLQTLIIDEGFGSQDEEGIAHIADALYKIQDHFAKIIIVSHLPSMKDNFPIHFLIEKGPHGSSITVHQQG
ncbi:MAG TPA: SMC family ATPase [Candidatus Babeliales bacterium]|nr:SMC family ATPase [Candidatus Babeliales bacterium]